MISVSLSLQSKASEWESSGSFEANGGELHYKTAGQGKPLILLHGYSGYSGQWQRFLPEFIERHQVIAIDLPGHGGSAPLQGTFDVDQTAQDIWQLLDHLKIKQVTGIGYSAGGMSLLQMARLEPSRMVSMVLAASAFEVSAEIERGTFDSLPEGYQQDLMKNHNGDLEKIGAMLSAVFRSDIDPESLKTLSVPTLLIAGDRDESFPLEIVSETYRVLPNAQLMIVPGLGHTLFWPWGGSERLADQFPSVVLRFFDEAN